MLSPSMLGVDTGHQIAGADKAQQEVSNQFRAKEVVNIAYLLYFQGRGSDRARVFFDKINGAFVCFVMAAIRFCLKAWITGERDRSSDFRYESA